MCLGFQEYFQRCHDPGNFVVTTPCATGWRCTARVEERILTIPGECPRCRDTRAIGLPRGVIAPRGAVAGAGAGSGSGPGAPLPVTVVSSMFENLEELETYHRRKVKGLQRYVAVAESKLKATRRKSDWVNLQCAITSVRDAEREFHSAVWEYRVEEVRAYDRQVAEEEAAAAAREVQR
ncbi:MAG: hypothetical protein M1816_003525 [Peltula sp. TS41687]|nr:MAG: hypothetical protein M1816_003525 [Peltula sp. TS41687]